MHTPTLASWAHRAARAAVVLAFAWGWLAPDRVLAQNDPFPAVSDPPASQPCQCGCPHGPCTHAGETPRTPSIVYFVEDEHGRRFQSDANYLVRNQHRLKWPPKEGPVAKATKARAYKTACTCGHGDKHDAGGAYISYLAIYRLGYLAITGGEQSIGEEESVAVTQGFEGTAPSGSVEVAKTWSKTSTLGYTIWWAPEETKLPQNALCTCCVQQPNPVPTDHGMAPDTGPQRTILARATLHVTPGEYSSVASDVLPAQARVSVGAAREHPQRLAALIPAATVAGGALGIFQLTSAGGGPSGHVEPIPVGPAQAGAQLYESAPVHFESSVPGAQEPGTFVYLEDPGRLAMEVDPVAVNTSTGATEYAAPRVPGALTNAPMLRASVMTEDLRPLAQTSVLNGKLTVTITPASLPRGGTAEVVARVLNHEAINPAATYTVTFVVGPEIPDMRLANSGSKTFVTDIPGAVLRQAGARAQVQAGAQAGVCHVSAAYRRKESPR